MDYIVFPPIDLGTSTNINESSGQISIFPNPTIGTFRIEFLDNIQRLIKIYDMNGKLVDIHSSNDKSILFDISTKPAGTYTIKLLPEGITYQILKN